MEILNIFGSLNQTQIQTNVNNAGVPTNVVTAQPTQVSTQNVNGVSQNVTTQSTTSQQQVNVTTEQRVNLIEKPTIHGVVPSKGTSTISEVKSVPEEKVEVFQFFYLHKYLIFFDSLEKSMEKLAFSYHYQMK